MVKIMSVFWPKGFQKPRTECNLKVENALLNWKQKFLRPLRTVLRFILITHKTETVLNLNQWIGYIFNYHPMCGECLSLALCMTNSKNLIVTCHRFFKKLNAEKWFVSFLWLQRREEPLCHWACQSVSPSDLILRCLRCTYFRDVPGNLIYAKVKRFILPCLVYCFSWCVKAWKKHQIIWRNFLFSFLKPRIAATACYYLHN